VALATLRLTDGFTRKAGALRTHFEAGYHVRMQVTAVPGPSTKSPLRRYEQTTKTGILGH
jgi:hypothetical protein